MKYFILIFLTYFIGLKWSSAQQSAAQTLRLAQSIYEQGRLHELPTVLKKKEIPKYAKTDQVNAYRLLTLAHIYLEEPESADSTMLELIKADPFYEPNEQVEPAEFIGLYKTFRTKPLFNIGLKIGINGTIPKLEKIYYVAGNAPGNGKYGASIAFQFGLVFEKEIFNHWKNKAFGNGKLMFTPEVFYTSRSFTYNNSEFYSLNPGDKESAGIFNGTIRQTRLDVNPILQLKLGKSKTFVPYLAAGPGVSYLLSASNTMVFTRKKGPSDGSGVNGSDVDYKNNYIKFVPSLIAMAGLKYKFGSIFLLAEFRVQYGLMNPVNPKARTNQQGTLDYGYQLPDYKPLNLMANIGFIYPYFNPIKIRHK